MIKKVLDNNWHLKIGIILTSLLFVFMCLEIVTRLFIKPPPTVIIENLNKGKNLDLKYPVYENLYIDTPAGLRLRRNVKVIKENPFPGMPDIEITTNSLGFRNKELKEKQPDEFRILVLGDSITMGDYLPNDQTYPSKIGKYLKLVKNSLSRKNKHVVINAGVATVDLETEYAILLERGLQAKPDLVLVGLYLNDAYGSPSLKVIQLPVIFRSSYFLRVLFGHIDKLRAVYRAYSLKSIQDETIVKDREEYFKAYKRNKDGSIAWNNEFEKAKYDNFFDWGYAWSNGYWNKIMPLIEIMGKTSIDENFRRVIVYFPVVYQIIYDDKNAEPQKRFEYEMHKRNILHLDLLPLLKEKYKKDGINLFIDHCHLNKDGCDFVGKCIAEYLGANVLNKIR